MPLEPDPAVLEHVAAVGDGERERHLLLGDQESHALLLESFERLECDLGDLRGETGRRLVEHEQPRPRHQRATHRQHLLLPAAQGSCLLALSLPQARKEVVDELERRGIRPPRVGTEVEIALQGHRREEMPLGGHVRDPSARYAVGGTPRQVLPVEDDSTGHRRKQPGDRPEERRLARAVRADDHHRLAGANLDVDVVDDPLAEIPGRQPGDLKQRVPVRGTRRRPAGPA